MKAFAKVSALFLCLCLFGCAHTEQGLKEDTKQDEPKVEHALKHAGHDAAVATQKAAKSVESEAGKAAAKTNNDKNAKPNRPAKG